MQALWPVDRARPVPPDDQQAWLLWNPCVEQAGAGGQAPHEALSCLWAAWLTGGGPGLGQPRAADWAPQANACAVWGRAPVLGTSVLPPPGRPLMLGGSKGPFFTTALFSVSLLSVRGLWSRDLRGSSGPRLGVPRTGAEPRAENAVSVNHSLCS